MESVCLSYKEFNLVYIYKYRMLIRSSETILFY